MTTTQRIAKELYTVNRPQYPWEGIPKDTKEGYYKLSKHVQRMVIEAKLNVYQLHCPDKELARYMIDNLIKELDSL